MSDRPSKFQIMRVNRKSIDEARMRCEKDRIELDRALKELKLFHAKQTFNPHEVPGNIVYLPPVSGSRC